MRAHPAQTLWSKLVWFVGLWLAGVSMLALVSLAIKAWLR